MLSIMNATTTPTISTNLCGFCNGSGRHPYFPLTAKCNACKGSGTMSPERFAFLASADMTQLQANANEVKVGK